MIIVRELTGGLYYGEPRGIEGDRAVNTMVYTRPEIERVTRKAFRTRARPAQESHQRRQIRTSSKFRSSGGKVVIEVAKDYPDVELDHLLVDNCAMQLVLNPRRFDVLVTENMFGDILSDEGGGAGRIHRHAAVGVARRIEGIVRARAWFRARYRGSEQSQPAGSDRHRRHRCSITRSD